MGQWSPAMSIEPFMGGNEIIQGEDLPSQPYFPQVDSSQAGNQSYSFQLGAAPTSHLAPWTEYVISPVL